MISRQSQKPFLVPLLIQGSKPFFSIRLAYFLLVLAAIIAMLTSGCGPVNQNVTRGQMVQLAINSHKTVFAVEDSLNSFYALGLLTPQEHKTLDPAIQAARAARDTLTQKAIDPAITSTTWRTAWDAFNAALIPLLQAELRAEARKTAVTSPSTRPAFVKPSTLVP